MPLSAEQRHALWNNNGEPIRGLITVSARPGTGKTTTLTDYCIDMAERRNNELRSWQGLAVLSYTNVAKDELEHKIRSRGRATVLLRSPHFLGTLDAFINQHLFLPHGARIMQYSHGRPQLVGEPHYPWTMPDRLCANPPNRASSARYFDCYSLDASGAPYVIDHEPRQINYRHSKAAARVTATNRAKIVAMKRHVWSNGAAVQADANYIALETLRTSPALTKALVGRFPVLIIDEAQDLTEVQHAIIDHLIAANHNHVVLVGDENQAIYEWNTARPQLFIDKRTPLLGGTRQWNPRDLGRSYRCSSAVCAALTAMSGNRSPLIPADGARNAVYPLPIDIAGYGQPRTPVDVITAIESLAAKLTNTTAHTTNENNIKTIAVIGRATADVRILKAAYTGVSAAPGSRVHWGDSLTRSYLKVIHQLRQHGIPTAVPAYEALIARAGEHTSVANARIDLMTRLNHSPSDIVAYRSAIVGDLRRIAAAMPTQASTTISDCIAACDIDLASVPAAQMTRMRNDCNDFRSDTRAGQNHTLSTLFTSIDDREWHTPARYDDVQLTFSTAHGVKGETYDGVIFYTKDATASCGCPDGRSATTWSAILNHTLAECETKRIAYVALSRAAQALTILTPTRTSAAWHDLLRPSALDLRAADAYQQDDLFADLAIL